MMQTVHIKTSDRNNKIVAATVTVVVHAVLLLIFLLIVFHTPIPPFPDSGSPGIEVNLGNSDQGMGDVLTDNFTPAEVPQQTTVKTSSAKVKTTTTTSNERIITSSTGEPAVTNNTANTTTQTAEAKQPEMSTDLQNALAKWKTRSQRTGNDGITGNPGNQGDPNGSNNTNNYIGANGHGNEPGGDGTGKGTKWSLKGRKILMRPELADDSQESGIVVVEITVDKFGNVSKAIPGARGSTTANSVLYAKARQAAMKAKFNASPEGVEEQKGTVTFNFILN